MTATIADLSRRCPLHYQGPAEHIDGIELECHSFHRHHRDPVWPYVEITDWPAHFAADQRWDAELRAVAAMSARERAQVVIEQQMTDADAARIETLAHELTVWLTAVRLANTVATH